MKFQPTLFPVPAKLPPPVRVHDGEHFDWRVFAWTHGAVCPGSTFPIKRWVRDLKRVEETHGKMKAVKAWCLYLRKTEERYVSAASFARTAGYWIRRTPKVADHHFQSRDAVHEFVKSLQYEVAPPHWIVAQGPEAIAKWKKENK